MSAACILYIPHGGGPLPLMGDAAHASLNRFLETYPQTITRPDAIIVISAHWEEPVVTVTAGTTPPLIYDYYGFPTETYEYAYPAVGWPELAGRVQRLLTAAGIDARLDQQRGFDHGLFVPLMLMYPHADIPCIQISLDASLDAAAHLRVGKALAALKSENLLILGSGFSFHNLSVIMNKSDDAEDPLNRDFELWLEQTCCDAELSEIERERRLSDWAAAPQARYCHPREEHLLPLQVCYGIGGAAAELVFRDRVARVLTSAYRW